MVQRGKVSSSKLQEVEKISALVKDFKVIGLAKLGKVPAKALHNLRDTLRGDVIIRMSKKKLIQKAFKASKKKNLTELADKILGITAMLFTNMNPIKSSPNIRTIIVGNIYIIAVSFVRISNPFLISGSFPILEKAGNTTEIIEAFAFKK